MSSSAVRLCALFLLSLSSVLATSAPPRRILTTGPSILLTNLTILGPLTLDPTVGGRRGNPGVILRTTRKGISYALQVASKSLKTKILQSKIPDLNSGGKQYIRAYNMKLSGFEMPTFTYSLIAPNTVQLRSSGGKGTIAGRFKARKKIIFYITKRGKFTVKFADLRMTVATRLLKTADGKPKLSGITCSATIRKLSVKFKAGFIGWIMNMFHKKIEKKLKAAITKNLCNTLKKYAYKQGNDFLADLQTNANVYKGLKLDYSLVKNPQIQTNFLDLYVSGETRKSGLAPTPFFPHRMQISAASNRMAYVFLSDFAINSFLYQAHTAGFIIYHGEKNKKIAKYLRTECADDQCIGAFVPDLADKFPNTTGKLEIKSKTKPTILFTTGKATLQVTLETTLSFKTTKALSFDIVGQFELKSLRVKQVGSKNVISGSAQVKTLRAQNVHVYLSELSLVADLVPTLISLIKPAASSELAQIGNKGFPLPNWNHLNLRNPQLRLLRRTLLVSADLRYVG